MGLKGLLGSMPITWHEKRQSSVMTSAFGYEFAIAKKAVEEAMACMCYFRLFSASATKFEIA